MNGSFWSLRALVCLFTDIVCPVPHIGDFLEQDFGFERDGPPGQWQRGYIGLPSQRKTSNCDVSAKDRPQHGREAEGVQSPFYDAEKSGSASLKG